MAKKRQKIRSATNSIPTGVKVISILNYAIAVILLLSALAFFFSAATFASSEEAKATAVKLIEDLTASTTIAASLITSLSSIFALAGVIALLFAILFFFMARGLWKGQNWARILTIIFFTIGFIGALADVLRGDFVGNIPQVIIDGLIAGYLLFNVRVKSAFSR